jgi:hypothetical protein
MTRGITIAAIRRSRLLLRFMFSATFWFTVAGCGRDDHEAATSDASAVETSVSSGALGATDMSSAKASAVLPSDPCAVVTKAMAAIGWSMIKQHVGDGPGGPNTQCTFDASNASGMATNGWVAFIPTSQIALEYHEPKAVSGVGVEAYRGSPQTGEILATGAPVPFRIFVAHSNDDAISLAAAVVTAS